MILGLRDDCKSFSKLFNHTGFEQGFHNYFHFQLETVMKYSNEINQI